MSVTNPNSASAHTLADMANALNRPAVVITSPRTGGEVPARLDNIKQDAKSQFNLGACYSGGEGVGKDYVEA